MRVNLKSGEYHDYYKIKRVEILEHYIIRITGSAEQRKKSTVYQVHLEAIKNIREFNRFLRKEMKEFHADGVCEYCGSLNVEEQGTILYLKKLNEPKEKDKIKSRGVNGYRCRACGRLFSDLKPVDLVIYY